MLAGVLDTLGASLMSGSNLNDILDPGVFFTGSCLELIFISNFYKNPKKKSVLEFHFLLYWFSFTNTNELQCDRKNGLELLSPIYQD